MPGEDTERPRRQDALLPGGELRSGGTDLIKSSHEAGVVVEGRHDQRVVLLVDVQGRLHVHLRVLGRHVRVTTSARRPSPNASDCSRIRATRCFSRRLALASLAPQRRRLLFSLKTDTNTQTPAGRLSGNRLLFLFFNSSLSRGNPAATPRVSRLTGIVGNVVFGRSL